MTTQNDAIIDLVNTTKKLDDAHKIFDLDLDNNAEPVFELAAIQVESFEPIKSALTPSEYILFLEAMIFGTTWKINSHVAQTEAIHQLIKDANKPISPSSRSVH